MWFCGMIRHTFHYVIHMCQILFGFPLEKGLKIAKQVHLQGKAVLLTTTKEHAELKQERFMRSVATRWPQNARAACRPPLNPSFEKRRGTRHDLQIASRADR